MPKAPGRPADDEALTHAVSAFHHAIAARGTPNERACFRQAAVAFEHLRRRGASNPALFLDLGNASLLAGDLPHAILDYRRGLRLAPNNRGLRADLAYARDQVVYPAPGYLGRPAADFWPPRLPRLTPALTWRFFIAAYSAGWLLLTRWWMRRRGRPLLAGAGAFTLAVVLAVVLAVQAWRSYQEERHPLVVIAADDTYLLTGNGPSYPRRYDTPLNRGVEARLRYARAGWLQLELPDGALGWVPQAACLVDTDPGAPDA